MNELTKIQTTAGVVDTTAIAGWGSAIDTANDPTYPYRVRDMDDHSGEWRRPTLQQSSVEVLQSIEHKWRPAVFGTTSPPRGLSGMIRRAAFRWCESNLMHWLLLMGADRVNTFEGIFEDIARLRVPNYRFLAKFIGALVAIAVIVLIVDALAD